jgi:hypothetical protein
MLFVAVLVFLNGVACKIGATMNGSLHRRTRERKRKKTQVVGRARVGVRQSSQGTKEKERKRETLTGGH